ncbi:glycosyltransferase family 1 protein [Paenibacillus polygoni]|uniref:Glycosyltransferase family 1 protein n=1 Tax=Paenibacillus polygoni TaxID=3050112 RepID=A0ABY8X3A5_9BACL|nr:glycosyltransferase family 1 protein [Paenibacillus polygoni]WIV20010.1 glycosyltransferase family 1 protein [Paenibacillus polygoni]
MKKNRVLQVIGSLSMGGAENVAMNLYRYIDREKFEYHYLVYGEKIGIFEKEVLALGGKVIHIDEPSNGYIKFSKEIEKVLIEHGPYDIIHSHTLFNSGFALKMAKKVGVKKRIAHSHSTKNKVRNSIYIKFYQVIMRKLILKYATDYISCSQEAGVFLFGEKVFLNRGKIMKNGIKLDKYKFNPITRQKVREEFNINHKFVVGHVGRLVQVKNQLFLIDIFKQLVTLREDACLILVGEGNDRGLLEDKINEYKLTSSVILTGNRDDADELMQAMDVFVFPSLFEGLGLALIEAQAAGLHCIASNKVPREAFITDLVKQISLDEPIEHWANIINEIQEVDRNQYYPKLEKGDYNIELLASSVESLYLD